MKKKTFLIGFDPRTKEYVPVKIARKNLDRYEIISIPKNFIASKSGEKPAKITFYNKESVRKRKLKELRKLIYEPIHIEGGVCWCRVTYEKRTDGKLHIIHQEQRDTITKFVEDNF